MGRGKREGNIKEEKEKYEAEEYQVRVCFGILGHFDYGSLVSAFSHCNQIVLLGHFLKLTSHSFGFSQE